MAGTTSEFYRQRALAMRAQVERAETPYLKGIYNVIADNWETLSAQMQAGAILVEKEETTPKL
jgi:hypothetical protein